MNFKKIIDERYTTKNYKQDQEIKKEDMDKIIHAIHYCPSASNLQNGRVVIVKDKTIRENISKYFMPQNRPRVTLSGALLIFIGIKIEKMLENEGSLIYNHAYKNAPLNEQEKQDNKNSVIKFYQSPNMKEISKTVDIITSVTQYNFAMLQATELGYSTTTMIGYKYEELEKELRKLNIIENNERLVMTMSIGKELENDEVNNYSRIKKRADIKDIITIL